MGDSTTVTVRSPSGEVNTYPITLQQFPSADRFAYLIIPYLTGLIYFACSLWVFVLRRETRAAQNFSMFASAIAIGLFGLFDIYTSNRLTYLWTAALAVAGGAMVALSLLFPQEQRLVQRRPYVTWIGYLLSIVLFGFAASILFNIALPLAYLTAWQLEYIYLGFSLLFFIGWVVYRYITARLPLVREQSRLIVIGSVLAFGPLCVWLILKTFQPELSFWPYLLLLAGIFPAATAYTIVRYRMLNTDLLLNRAILYSLLTILTAAGYALLISGVALLLGDQVKANNPYIIGIYVFLLAFLFNPVRARLQVFIDKAFSREQSFYQEGLTLFSRQLTEALELEVIIALLRRIVQESVSPETLHIYVRDQLSDQYIATPDETGQNSSDLHFSTDGPLVKVLANQRKGLFLPDEVTLPTELHVEKARLALLGAQLFVPLPGRQQLTGWIALGQRKSGKLYNPRAIEFLEALCDQAALAVERAQVVSDLERRIHEMNVLTRVSQGINVTLVFDDILELIYAQANQVIHTRDFLITLFDSRTDILYHVFYLQDDERLTEKENLPIPYGQGLERDLIGTRRAFLTDDYQRECRSRGTLPAMLGIFAWMGVPLNTGAETIGVISAGSRDSTVLYTSEQMNILQAIADQAAGAIVKAQLLQEAERRARQLTTLNEVARSMTSTLELQPLLNQILQSAVDILNCEAGSLLLVDNQTDELVFEVAVGPVATDLIGQRLPGGTGLVGKAVNTRQPIIVNDVRRSKEWFDKPDEQTGFVTNDLLVVPMQFKDEIMGVIEVINRRDGLPFTSDDLELLSAFTSQAAVAMENARLYTLTDQTLGSPCGRVIRHAAHRSRTERQSGRLTRLTDYPGMGYAPVESRGWIGRCCRRRFGYPGDGFAGILRRVQYLPGHQAACRHPCA